MKAREARVRLLDSIDKAITIVHLLTNTQWGSETARFLSCSQSLPLRDKRPSLGDRNVAKVLDKSCREALDILDRDRKRFGTYKELIQSLRSENFITEMRYIEGNISIVVELMPTLNPALSNSHVSTCILTIYEESPKIVFHPVVRTLVDTGAMLVVCFNEGSVTVQTSNSESFSGVVEEVHAGRMAVLDYMIVAQIQKEVESNKLPDGWVCTEVSKHPSKFSISLVGPTGDEIQIALGSRAQDIPEHTMTLRSVFVDMCSLPRSDVILVQEFFETLIGTPM